MTRPDLRIVPPVDYIAPFQFVPSHSPPTWRDDLSDFIADVRRDPQFALICAALGFILGLAVTIGLAQALVWTGAVS